MEEELLRKIEELQSQLDELREILQTHEHPGS
jgi:hypothetical protein